jgi:hypothetical protein
LKVFSQGIFSPAIFAFGEWQGSSSSVFSPPFHGGFPA